MWFLSPAEEPGLLTWKLGTPRGSFPRVSIPGRKTRSSVFLKARSGTSTESLQYLVVKAVAGNLDARDHMSTGGIKELWKLSVELGYHSVKGGSRDRISLSVGKL